MFNRPATPLHKAFEKSHMVACVYSFGYPCEDYSDCIPYDITFSPCFCFLECWSAFGSFLTDEYRLQKEAQVPTLQVFLLHEENKNFTSIGGSKSLTVFRETIKGVFNAGKGGDWMR